VIELAFNHDKIRGIKKRCPICGKMIGITAFNRHIRSCEKCKKDNYLQENLKYKCPICGKEFDNKRSFSLHYSYCSGKRTVWNKGLTKETDERVKKYLDGMKEHYKTNGNKKYGICSEEYLKSEKFKDASRRGGLKSAQVKNKRSKNEIYFADLLIEAGFNVVCNEPFFDGWDADIIIHDLKVAILWNGIWHYKKVRKSHSLEQVQSRDKIKQDKIKLFGYDCYIIKDMGKYNEKFVKQEFEKFMCAMTHNGTGQPL